MNHSWVDEIAKLRAPFSSQAHWRYTAHRAKKVYGQELSMDKYNIDVIKALCHYFTLNPMFETMLVANTDGSATCRNWKLRKGLLILGDVGTGKTFLMKAFNVNKRANYRVIPALTIATEYTDKEGGHTLLNKYKHNTIPLMSEEYLKYSSEKTLWKTTVGLCIDDIGTEETYYTHMGNKSSPIAEILSARYDNIAPHLTHLTTNLSMSEIKEKYGPRIFSRIKQNFNLIPLPGPDRRLEK